jgi:tetratricopeptide (TPR) repeat protein
MKTPRNYLSLIIVTLVLLLSAGTTVRAAEPPAFREGNTFYKNGQYDSAIERYASILGSGLESAAIYYNIGNCCFKKGEWGRAVLYYERAMRLCPRDPEIKFNRRLALSKTSREELKTSGPALHRASRYIFSRVTVDEATVALMVLYLIGLFLVAWVLARPDRSLGARLGIGFAVLIFLFGNLFLYDKIKSLGRDGIILAKTVAAKFEPSEDATTYFDLVEGASVTTLGSKDDWVKIQRDDGKAGWIPRDAQETI